MSRTHSGRLEPGVWKIIAVAILGPFMSNMDSTVVNVPLSFIRQALHSSIASAQWVVNGYLLAWALMLPAAPPLAAHHLRTCPLGKRMRAFKPRTSPNTRKTNAFEVTSTQ